MRSDQKGTIDDQEANAYETAERLLTLIRADYNIVVTHGNGPQVGNILLSNTAGNKLYGLPDMPLDVAVAYSQGFIGYIIEQQLRNVMMANDLDRDIISIITQVLVDKNDPAFISPTKPVGPYYTKEESERITAETGATFAADPRNRGYRKVVASPKPLVISNQKSIESLARAGQIVIAVGGGGIPSIFMLRKTSYRESMLLSIKILLRLCLQCRLEQISSLCLRMFLKFASITIHLRKGH